ncbi:MAG: MBL fold metallo-hydrolase [Polyangiaceae bacterium]
MSNPAAQTLRVHQIRSATVLLEIAEHRLVVDPMLSDVGALPGFKLFGGGRRANPLVPLPPCADACFAAANGVLVTHEHPDHLDGPGRSWARSRGLPVWASAVDVPSLRARGLDARELVDGALGMRVEVIENRHGRGLVGWAMGPVSGFFLAALDAPSVYLTGDAILTPNVVDAVDRLDPDVIVAPAGAANSGEAETSSSRSTRSSSRGARGDVVLNHLEALTIARRPARRSGADRGRLSARVHVLEDGEALVFRDPRVRPSPGATRAARVYRSGSPPSSRERDRPRGDNGHVGALVGFATSSTRPLLEACSRAPDPDGYERMIQ